MRLCKHVTSQPVLRGHCAVCRGERVVTRLPPGGFLQSPTMFGYLQPSRSPVMYASGQPSREDRGRARLKRHTRPRPRAASESMIRDFLRAIDEGRRLDDPARVQGAE